MTFPHRSENHITFALVGDPQYSVDRETKYGRDFKSAKRKLECLIEQFNAVEDLDFVVSLGDLGDGQRYNEIPEILSCYAKSRVPVKYVVGNHDYVIHTEDELKSLYGVESLFYDFSYGTIRFIVLNGLDVSYFSPSGSARRAESIAYKRAHEWLGLRDWDGMLSQSSKTWLKGQLDDSLARHESVVLLCHVPICHEATADSVRMWDHAELLSLLDCYPHVRAWFAGHYHPGGLAVRNGVVHKTVKAICNCQEPTGLVARVYADRIELTGIGEEVSSVHAFNWTPSVIRGTAPAGSIVMTDTGELADVGADGRFALEVPVSGMYSLKAVADGKKDAYVPMVKAPANGICITQEDEPERRLYRGDAHGFATLFITDDGQPVRWFDLACTPFGGAQIATPMWHEESRHSWTRGPYAFTATGTVVVNQQPYYPAIRRRGWYKGDFHAHIVHGENIYKGNLPIVAFAAQAEHYDWLWCSADVSHDSLMGDFANDGVISDSARIAQMLSTPDFLLRLNTEFPKNWRGHSGNLGVPPIFLKPDCTKVTNLELIREYVTGKGGVSIPVHPLYNDVIRVDDQGHSYSCMTNKEVFLQLLCDPESCPCLDVFYNDDTPDACNYWYGLLNRGYTLGCTATSDAAFDVGRAPGTPRGATLVRLEQLTEENILQAFRRRQTAVTWDGAAILLDIDGATSGDILRPDGSQRTVVLSVFDRPGKTVQARIIRNGEIFWQHEMTMPETGMAEFHVPLREKDISWYLAELRGLDAPQRIRAACSPVYFRDERFSPPEVLPMPAHFSDDFMERTKLLGIEDLANPDFIDTYKQILRVPSSIYFN